MYYGEASKSINKKINIPGGVHGPKATYVPIPILLRILNFSLECQEMGIRSGRFKFNAAERGSSVNKNNSAL